MKAIYADGDPEKGKKKKRQRGRKKGSSADNTNTSDNGVKGSCEAGDLRACKTEVKKTPKFNPNKKRISKGRLVGAKAIKKAKRQEERQNKKEQRQKKREQRNKRSVRPQNPLFL